MDHTYHTNAVRYKAVINSRSVAANHRLLFLGKLARICEPYLGNYPLLAMNEIIEMLSMANHYATTIRSRSMIERDDHQVSYLFVLDRLLVNLIPTRPYNEDWDFSIVEFGEHEDGVEQRIYFRLLDQVCSMQIL